MSEFIVHSIPGSPFGRTVMTALEEKGVSWRLSPVMPGTMRSPEHLSRHAFGRVPVLRHDDFSLYETQAILRYVDRILPTPPLTPSDSRKTTRPTDKGNRPHQTSQPKINPSRSASPPCS